MKRTVLTSIACLGAVLLTAICFQPDEPATEEIIRVVPGGPGSSDPAFAPQTARLPAARGAPAPDFVLLETEAAGEDDRGAAIVRLSGGDVRRVAVDDWIDGGYRLTAVSDTDATLTDGRHLITLPIEPPPPIASNPAGGLPGVDFNQPGKANPGMALH